MVDRVQRADIGQQGDSDDNSQGDVIKRRTDTTIIIQIPLRAEQIQIFKSELEALCNKFLNLDDEVLEEVEKQRKEHLKEHLPVSSDISVKAVKKGLFNFFR